MNHREFLLWLEPQLQTAKGAGLSQDKVVAIRAELERMREAGTLQPFASRLLSLVKDQATLDAQTVARIAKDIRSELAPPREKTMVLSAVTDGDEEPEG